VVAALGLPAGVDLTNTLAQAGGLAGILALARWGVGVWVSRQAETRAQTRQVRADQVQDLGDLREATVALTDAQVARVQAEQARSLAELELRRVTTALAQRDATVAAQAKHIVELEAQQQMLQGMLDDLKRMKGGQP